MIGQITAADTPMIGQTAIFVSGVAAAITLDSLYVNNTSGDAFAVRYMARSTATIDAIWVYCTAVTGSPTLAASIYGDQDGQIGRPANAATLDTSTASDTPAANKWIKITFGTPLTPTLGQVLWIVVHCTNGDAGNNCDIRTAGTHYADYIGTLMGFTTASGFSTAGTALLEAPFIIKQGSLYHGWPFTAASSAPYTSNTLERGIKFTCPVTCKVDAFYYNGTGGGGSANISHFRLYGSTGAPGGVTGNMLNLDLDAITNVQIADDTGVVVFSEQTLNQGSVYIATFAYSGAITTPGAMQIEDFSGGSPDYNTEIVALRDASTFSYPISVISDGSGTPAFVENKALCPKVALRISDYPTAVAGSTGGPGRIIGG